MSFVSTSRNIRMKGSTLTADCKNEKGEFVFSSLDLDRYLGNADGEFDTAGIDFSRSAKNVRIDSRGVLRADLLREDGGERAAAIELDTYVANDDGTLVFEIPESEFGAKGLKEKIAVVDFTTWRFSSAALNLDRYIGNKDGCFAASSRHFSLSASNIAVDQAGLLPADLRRIDGSWASSIIDLKQFVANVDGRLVFSRGF